MVTAHIDTDDLDTLVPDDVLPADDQIGYRPKMSEDFDSESGAPRLPIIKIMQSNSPEVVEQEGSAGHFYSSTIGDMGESITIIPLQTGLSRIFNNPDKRFADSEIVCSSQDGKEGTIRDASDYGEKRRITGDCATCPMKEWGPRDPKTGRGSPPLCTLHRSFNVYAPEEELLAQIDFSRTGMPAAEDMLTQIRLKREWGTLAFQLGLRHVKGSNPYYKPVTRVLRASAVKAEWFEGAKEMKELVAAS